jgi:MerR HTH family regulatory protein
MDTPDGPPVLRIGELSRRLGVSDHALRAWESRAPLALAGAGATAQIATAVGAQLLTGDPVTEAGQAGWPR